MLMAELATDPANSHKLVDGQSKVTKQMVDHLETMIDDVSSRFEMPKEFVVPGEDVVAAYIDVARSVVRRAERRSMVVVGEDSQVVPYLNRLSDLCWALARWAEGASLTSRGT